MTCSDWNTKEVLHSARSLVFRSLKNHSVQTFAISDRKAIISLLKFLHRCREYNRVSSVHVEGVFEVHVDTRNENVPRVLCAFIWFIAGRQRWVRATFAGAIFQYTYLLRVEQHHSTCDWLCVAFMKFLAYW